jgi:lysozyme family protein
LFAGDDFPSQIIANEVFDTSVNMGMGKAVEFLQISLNALNRNSALYPDISTDGKFGMNTLKALVTYLATDKEDLLYKMLNILQGYRYIDLTIKNPTQEKFLRGWMSRINFVKL